MLGGSLCSEYLALQPSEEEEEECETVMEQKCVTQNSTQCVTQYVKVTTLTHFDLECSLKKCLSMEKLLNHSLLSEKLPYKK